MAHYAVIQIGYAIFGTGNTPQAALLDAQQWCGPITDQLKPLASASHGDMILIPCTERLALDVQARGEAAQWDIFNGEADLIIDRHEERS